MAQSKLTLTIKGFLGAGTVDWSTEVRAAILSERPVRAVKLIRLKVLRKPDKYSTRFSVLAALYQRDGYQSLGFTEATVAFDTFAADGKLVARTLQTFTNVWVESYDRGDDEETIVFIAGKVAESAVSKIP
jgi:hypothetical protein